MPALRGSSRARGAPRGVAAGARSRVTRILPPIAGRARCDLVELLACPSLSPTQKIVALAVYAAAQAGRHALTMADISARTGIPPADALRAVAWLLDRGVLLARVPHSGSRLTGGLNPRFCEWLMGWPIGWSALRPLATARFRRWLSRHGTP